ncbi:hypothetical protein [Thermomonas aquatica]|uniref:Uncharacterized protein n=1 Tax=Thermomonas aquatica TaxID=2202149 RepID=A0A5B7ZMW1_9GAMM|nr:hypothetical protein [Thermomonas aquatica]QDA56461.1 hypothetical protein FHQ07_03615 [Thermomonas aquatica]
MAYRQQHRAHRTQFCVAWVVHWQTCEFFTSAINKHRWLLPNNSLKPSPLRGLGAVWQACTPRRGRCAARLSSGVRSAMKITAFVIYVVSLALFFPLTFRLKLLEKPKQLNFGALGTLKPTPRDFYFLGVVVVLVAVGSTFILVHDVSVGVIGRWFDGPGISYLSVKDDPAQFRLQLYLKSAAIPFVLALGARILVYGRRLKVQT